MGLLGVLVQGIRRAVFSNEAGVGSAAIAHAAAKQTNRFVKASWLCLDPSLARLLSAQ